jgi:hypothetical protein
MQDIIDITKKINNNSDSDSDSDKTLITTSDNETESKSLTYTSDSGYAKKEIKRKNILQHQTDAYNDHVSRHRYKIKPTKNAEFYYPKNDNNTSLSSKSQMSPITKHPKNDNNTSSSSSLSLSLSSKNTSNRTSKPQMSQITQQKLIGRPSYDTTTNYNILDYSDDEKTTIESLNTKFKPLL